MIKWNEVRVGDVVSFKSRPESDFHVKCFLILKLIPRKEGHTDFDGLNLDTMQYDQCGIITSTEKCWHFVARIEDDD